jgi:hypothetical protein
MTEGILVKNFVEFYNLVKPFRQEIFRLDEFCRFVEEIELDCQCSKISQINRAINLYLKLPTLLSAEEKTKIREKLGGKSVKLLYQSEIFGEI